MPTRAATGSPHRESRQPGVGKVVIFARSVITDHTASGNYWDKGTSVKLDKATGKYTVSFKSFRHTPPEYRF